MQNRITVFNFLFNDSEIEEQFLNFFTKNGLDPLFTNEHRSSPINVGLIEARAIVNEQGAYKSDLKTFADDYLTRWTDNITYKEAIFDIINESKNVNGLMARIRKIIRYIKTIDDEYLHNTWNIVFYNVDLT